MLDGHGTWEVVEADDDLEILLRELVSLPYWRADRTAFPAKEVPDPYSVFHYLLDLTEEE